MSFAINLLILIATFYFLAKVVDLFFIETLELISAKLKLSSDIAGATFMAIGSSAPELFVSMLALFRPVGEQSIGAGTIVGSAIFNILVIIGVAAMFKRAKLTWQPVIRDLVFYMITILALLLTFIDGEITLFDSLIFVGLYGAYIYSFRGWKNIFPYTTKGDKEQVEYKPEESEIAAVRDESLKVKNVIDKLLSNLFFDLRKRPGFYLVNFVISILLIGLLSHFMVDSAVHVAEILGIPEVIIGLTVLAVGTSVPDLLSSINVAKKGKGDMAISNAVGSNIFDINVGLGLPWVLMTLFQIDRIPVETENLASSIVLLFATVVALLYILLMKRWEMGKYGGLLLIFFYIMYLLIQMGVLSMNICIDLWSLGSGCVTF